MRPKFAFWLLLSALPVRAGELTGRLTLNDRPAAGITLSAAPYETSFEEARRQAKREPRPVPIGKAVTNAKGEWRLSFEVPPGKTGRIVGIEYAGPGVARGEISGHWDTADSDDTGETSLRRGVSLSGRVLDAEGRAVARAEVFPPAGQDSVSTNGEGKFSLEGVGEASNEVTVRKAGSATVRAVGLRPGAPAQIVLRPGLPFAGVVFGADAKTPVPGAVVRFEGKDAAEFAETDAEGRFMVREAAAGRVVVAVNGGASGFREVTGVAIPQPPETILTVVLAPAPELHGRVVDAAARKGIAGALVKGTSGGRSFWTRSASDGSFVLRPAPAGDWVLNAAAPRFVRVTRRLARAQRTEKPIELVLREGVTISGRVVDDQRRPVAAAKVRAMEQGVQRFGPTAAAVSTAITQEDGAFTLRRVPAVENLRLVTTHPDFEPASVGDLGLKAGETRGGVAIALRRGSALSGIVTFGDAPLAGVLIGFAVNAAGAPSRSFTGPQWSWPRATTGEDGRFRIGGLAPGDYMVTASKAGFTRETRRDVVVTEDRSPEPLTFVLAPEAVIMGSVKGKRGSGVAGQHVEAVPAEAGNRNGGSAQTLEDGTFRIDGLKPGVTYNLAVYSGMPGVQKKGVVAPAEGVELTATGSGRVAGRVVDAEGRPVPEFQVTAQADRSSSGFNWVDPVKQDVSSEAGEFVLEKAPAAVLEVRVAAKGFQAARVGGIVVEEGETRSGVEVKLSRGATLRGRVVEAKSGKPVPDIEIVVDSNPGGATSDADGAFEIEGLPPGKVRVTARGAEWAPTSETAEMKESGGSVDLKLSAGASVSAFVISPGGEPQAGAETNLTQVGQNAYGGTRAIAGPDGRVRFSHLAPGRYTLTAGSGGRRSKPVDVSVESDQARDDIRLVIGGGATVLASVTGLSPEERKEVSVLFGGGVGVAYMKAKELPDGRFEVRDVAAGTVSALARLGGQMDSGGRFVNRQVTVPEDGTVEVELPFEAGLTLTIRVLNAGQPVEGAYVYANPIPRETGTTGSATTDASGSCRLTGLKAGTYEVMAYSMTTSSAAPEQRIDLSADQNLEFAFPTGRLSGRVVASGSAQPLADAQVVIRTTNADGSFGLTHDATTDTAGRFQLTGLEAGSLLLTAQKKGYLVETRTVTADTDQDLVIELARGDGLDVTGRDGLLGAPLETFAARVFDGAGAELPTSYVLLDSAGVGEIPSLKPGSYSIIAAWRGFAPATYDGVPLPGPALAVRLTPGGTLDIDVPAERFKSKPLVCVVSGPRGLPLAFRQWGKRGDLSLAASSTHLTNFPAVSGTLACPGFTPLAYTVTEGGATRIAVK